MARLFSIRLIVAKMRVFVAALTFRRDDSGVLHAAV